MRMENKAKIIRRVSTLYQILKRREEKIKEAKRFIAQQPINEELTDIHRCLESMLEFLNIIDRWYVEIAKEIKKRSGIL